MLRSVVRTIAAGSVAAALVACGGSSEFDHGTDARVHLRHGVARVANRGRRLRQLR